MTRQMPAKVRHWVIRLYKPEKKIFVPVWDEEQRAWVITVEEEVKCGELLHWMLREETGEDYGDCSRKHSVRVVLRFRRRGVKAREGRWHLHARIAIDDVYEGALDPRYVISLLSKPTNPQGQGKVPTQNRGDNRQQMSVKRTTVIRV